MAMAKCSKCDVMSPAPDWPIVGGTREGSKITGGTLFCPSCAAREIERLQGLQCAHERSKAQCELLEQLAVAERKIERLEESLDRIHELPRFVVGGTISSSPERLIKASSVDTIIKATKEECGKTLQPRTVFEKKYADAVQDYATIAGKYSLVTDELVDARLAKAEKIIGTLPADWQSVQEWKAAKAKEKTMENKDWQLIDCERFDIEPDGPSSRFSFPLKESHYYACKRIEQLDTWLKKHSDALSFMTNAVDPDESEETADWELIDIRWRQRIDEMHKEIKRLQAIVAGVQSHVQATHPMGKVKHIGEREVVEAVREVCEQSIRAEAAKAAGGE